MLSHVIWALFWGILMQSWIKNIFDQNLEGRALVAPPPPPPWTGHCHWVSSFTSSFNITRAFTRTTVMQGSDLQFRHFTRGLLVSIGLINVIIEIHVCGRVSHSSLRGLIVYIVQAMGVKNCSFSDKKIILGSIILQTMLIIFRGGAIEYLVFLGNGC